MAGDDVRHVHNYRGEFHSGRDQWNGPSFNTSGGSIYINSNTSENLEYVLNQLPIVEQAVFNSWERQYDPHCLQGTRVDVLMEIQEWADGQDERRIFWLNGMAGTGKSTIARTVATIYNEQNRLGASFFFSRGDGDASNARKFFTSIAVQLASKCKSPSLKSSICEAIKKNPNIASQALSCQWSQLIRHPLELEDGSSQSPLIIVIDALDECDDKKAVRKIIELFANARSLRTVRVFMTSRPEVHIREDIRQIPETEHQEFVLHSVHPSIIDRDISFFLEYNFRNMKRQGVPSADWPDAQDIERLVQKANGLFIWAATAYRFVSEGRRRATDRLSRVLKGDTSATIPEKKLTDIYIMVLEHAGSNYEEDELVDFYKRLREILGTIVILFSSLSVVSLGKLLDIPAEDVDDTLDDLYAILNIPDEQDHPIRLHHPSFRDFLLNKQRCGDQRFLVDEENAHSDLANACIRLMSDQLKTDICDLQRPGALASDARGDCIESELPPELQYACRYWVEHLRRSQIQLLNDGPVHEFLREHLLHWFEVLGLIGKVSEGVLALISLESLVIANKCPALNAFIHDAVRFALNNRSVIEEAPLQIYFSALVFAPNASLIRKQFRDQIPRWIKRLPEVPKEWSPLLQTLEGHGDWVNTVAFSPDGKSVVSASRDETVRLWDTATGAAIQTLEGHQGPVNAVVFSPCGKIVASASDDKTVRLWDTATGTVTQILEGHRNGVKAVTFSPDGTLVASASNDKTIRLWDTTAGTATQTFEGHSNIVGSVAFSPDGKLVASASDDKTVRLWDIETGEAIYTLIGHFEWVKVAVFSPDGKLIASASHDKTVRLWDVARGTATQTLKGHQELVKAVAFSPDSEMIASVSLGTTVKLWYAATGKLIQTLEGHQHWVNAVAFSPDGKLIVSASDDKTIRLWDTATGTATQTFEGHSSIVGAVAFSPDGKLVASVSNDKTVRLWDVVTGATSETHNNHRDSVKVLALSPDGKLVVSASQDGMVRLWDIATGAATQILEGHRGWVNAVTFSPDGELIASASSDKTVRLWRAATGKLIRTLEGHRDWVNAVSFSPDGELVASASRDETVGLWRETSRGSIQRLHGHQSSVSVVVFSPDGKHFASASWDKTVKLWDAEMEEATQTLGGYPDSVNCMAFSPDGKLVASASWNRTVRIWCTATGKATVTLRGHTDWVNAVAFSPDSKLFASASSDKTVRLWHTVAGKSIQTLEGHRHWINAVAFSPDSNLIASASRDETVRLWDTETGKFIQKLEAHSDSVNAVTFSPDGKLIASTSADKTIILWDTVTGEAIQTFEGHRDSVTVVAFSPDSKLVISASYDKTIKLWNIAMGTAIRKLHVNSSIAGAVAISIDCKLVASISRDKTVRLWSIETCAPIQTLKANRGVVRAVAFSPDGKTIALAFSDKTVMLYDIATGEDVRSLRRAFKASTPSSDGKLWRSSMSVTTNKSKSHPYLVSAVAFSPDSELVASTTRNTVIIWNTTTREAIQTLEGHQGWVSAVAFSLDGKLIASASFDKTVRLWHTATGEAEQTLEVNAIISRLSFSQNGAYLETDRGNLGVLSHNTPVQVLQQTRFNLFVNDIWVARDTENLLWLPSEYRGTCAVYSNGTLVLGHASGRVTFMEVHLCLLEAEPIRVNHRCKHCRVQSI